jgi:hydroxyacylglutathione hydrolase
MASPSPIQALIAPVTPLQQNCTFVWCAATRRTAIIDPGGEVDRLLAVLKAKELELESIWLTHGHLDHAGGAAELKERTGAPIHGPHREDSFLLETIEAQGAMFGVQGARSVTPDHWLQEGDRVSIGEAEFEVYETPGHTPGHVIFFQREARFAQVGDVLFNGSIGRTDFPRGDLLTLVNSITTKLWPLGDDVQFVPGHGPGSTFGEERRSNPYVADQVLARAGG